MIHEGEKLMNHRLERYMMKELLAIIGMLSFVGLGPLLVMILVS